jgi:peptidoglycan/LPS O-acetylase OafA/YrhL
LSASSYYRRDIDGLRAIAVLLVILNHGGMGTAGGFIGVDVFFVISGFVITGLIHRGLKDGTFSFFDFWVRRILRIIPASAVVCLTTVLLSLFITFPIDAVETARSAIAQQLMLANFFFWKTTGYFDGPSNLKPLLHFWSLAVEEQFYLIYPIVLFLLSKPKFGQTTALLVFGASLIGLLLVSEIGCRRFPSAAYYLLPSRAWELLLGGLLSMKAPGCSLGRNFRSSLSIGSLLLILFIAFYYNSATRFPGLAAIPPCLLTCVIIWVNGFGGNLGKDLLQSSCLVGVGTISYSLYLWHWPIIVFMRYWQGNDLPLNLLIVWLVLTFLISYLSWKYIESPMRAASTDGRALRLVMACISFPLIIAVAGQTIAKQGYPERVPADVVRFQAARESKLFINEVTVVDALNQNYPVFGSHDGDLRCLVWGDSHAMALMPGINAACERLQCRGIQATHSATPPLLDFVYPDTFGLGDTNPIFADQVVRMVEQRRISFVIINASWNKYAANPEFKAKLGTTVSKLNAAGAKVILVLDVANQEVDVPSVLAKRAFWRLSSDGYGVSVELHRKRNQSVNQIIRSMANSATAVVDLETLFVNTQGTWLAISSGQVLYRDSSHLSVEGGLLLTDLFVELLDLENAT